MFRIDDCLEGHVLIGLVLSLASFVFLILTAFSTPYIRSITYLDTPSGVSFGSFGYCEAAESTTPVCHRSVGYEYGSEIIVWLTRTLILFAFAAMFMLLAFFALVLSLLKVGKFMWNPIYFRTTALLGTTLAILSEIFALNLFVTARMRYNAQGLRPTYGAALWLGLAGAIAGFVR
ncbi:hypothetical protein EHS25_003895 [Saitozyma podzolica]|uniref:Uncharacterized protein n=1 Tax=Saitozyma podzolica TaxID=1890683 RepID=A0A427Y3U6_9TREE|nr:hypothetical protein EHS25_003895 [Saitozyma podzolica]